MKDSILAVEPRPHERIERLGFLYIRFSIEICIQGQRFNTCPSSGLIRGKSLHM